MKRGKEDGRFVPDTGFLCGRYSRTVAEKKVMNIVRTLLCGFSYNQETMEIEYLPYHK
jgi:hypothetical protein